ncbi:odorant receptor 131-2-like [Anomaloglossus baeobatrachus]|uniref:odorant receptor 131-2-like n=1 Tax=Anomaloglossus baeobatrachus TaxID=238106 RepID=UPI003F501E49
MVDVEIPYDNKTYAQFYTGLRTVAENFRILHVTLISSTFCLYLPSVIVILCVSFTTAHIRENVRYLLFSHMLISDSLLLSLCFTLFIVALYIVFMPVKYCLILTIMTASTTLITPYNLALMSLERYIAVCFPLRHGEICTIRRCKVAIMGMWVIGTFPVLIEFICFCYFIDPRFFSFQMLCIWKYLQIYKFQTTIRFLTFSLSFSSVLVTILYTYIRVMLVARKIGSKKSSASKAAKTVLLHGFQLLLCLCSYSSTFTENFFNNAYMNMAPINFFLFMCLPLYISPFIYGIRDKTIRKSVRKLICST